MPTAYTDFTCTVCNIAGPECGFTVLARLKRGHLNACTKCCAKRSMIARAKRMANVVRIDGRKCKPRMSEEQRKQRNREKAAKHYHSNLEESRRQSRESARKLNAANPEAKRNLRLKYQYGMTPEAWKLMFEAQGCACAICRTTDPGPKTRWNTDHCHSSGIVRFILCSHCNRGLGAFKDNPDLMRRAADMLEAVYQDQANEPVAAIAAVGK